MSSCCFPWCVSRPCLPTVCLNVAEVVSVLEAGGYLKKPSTPPSGQLKFIMFNANFIIFNASFIILDAIFIILNTKFRSAEGSRDPQRASTLKH